MTIRRHYVLVFSTGVFTGLFMSFWGHQSQSTFIAARERIPEPKNRPIQPHVDLETNLSKLFQSGNEREFKNKDLVADKRGQDGSGLNLPDAEDQVNNDLDFNERHLHGVDTAVANELSQTVRILCLVFTYVENHFTKAPRVSSTWGQRCTKLLFVTNETIPSLPTMVVNAIKGYKFISLKTRQAFNYASDYVDDYDWFLKADDDTYVIMENLRYLLSEQNPNEALYFGHVFVKSSNLERLEYASGGAGYVISREALRRYREKSQRLCRFNTGAEDVDFGGCMASLKVPLRDSLDSLGKLRFHCFNPRRHLGGMYVSWYKRIDKYKGMKKGISDMSDYAISFHYVTPDDMLLLEYLVYHLGPYGFIKGLQDLNVHNTTISQDFSDKKWFI